MKLCVSYNQRLIFHLRSSPVQPTFLWWSYINSVDFSLKSVVMINFVDQANHWLHYVHNQRSITNLSLYSKNKVDQTNLWWNHCNLWLHRFHQWFHHERCIQRSCFFKRSLNNQRCTKEVDVRPPQQPQIVQISQPGCKRCINIIRLISWIRPITNEGYWAQQNVIFFLHKLYGKLMIYVLCIKVEGNVHVL